MPHSLAGRIFAGLIFLAVNVAVAEIVWIGTEPEAYLWSPHVDPRTLAAVREAGLAVFWAKWPVWAMLVNAVLGATLLLREGRRGWAAAMMGAGVLAHVAAGRHMAPRVAADYATLFELQERAEPLILEPVEDAGPAIGPYLLAYIRSDSAHRIRYAIDGIGRIGYAEAVPELVRIMDDPGQPYYIRADAWQALSAIGTGPATTAARRFQAAPSTRADTALSNYIDRIRSRSP